MALSRISITFGWLSLSLWAIPFARLSPSRGYSVSLSVAITFACVDHVVGLDLVVWRQRQGVQPDGDHSAVSGSLRREESIAESAESTVSLS